MKNLIIGCISAGSFALSGYAETNVVEKASTPDSMNEFINWHLDRGACGTWSDVGVTEDMWVGIPAGLKVTNTQYTRYDVATQQLFNSHHMATEDGKVISTGSNVMTWDADRKAVISAGSGFDMGKPYHGTSILMNMTDDSLSWEYTEMSQGKTTVYENVVTYTGRNVRSNSVRVQGGEGSPWVSEATRSNPAKEDLASIGLPGTWEKTMADGSVMRRKISWIADEHVLKYESMSKSADGTWAIDDLFVWYWDPTYDHIATLYLDDHGTVIHGKVNSISRDGDSVTIVATHEGTRFAGLTMSTQATQVITGDTFTTTFQDMSLDGVRHKMSWSEKANTTTRVK